MEERVQLDSALPPGAVYARLEPAVRRLVATNAALYAGRWDDFAEDVRRRQAGRPYLFKIDLGLADALAWIERLKDYEHARGEALAAALAQEER